MAGPVIRHYGKIDPWGQVLMGGAHSKLFADAFTAAGATGISPTSTNFALTTGAGLDIHLNRTLAIRLVEADYLLTRFHNPFQGTTNQNSFRFVTGLIINLH